MSQATLAPNSISPPSPRKITFEQFLARNDEHQWAEWVDGEVIPLSASTKHQDLCFFLARIIMNFVEERKLGKVMIPPYAFRCFANGAAREPDVLFLSKDRSHLIREKFLDGPADLVVEIVSDDGRTRDRRDKFREYAAGGVREYWLIDQPLEQAEFYLRSETGAYEPLPITEAGIVQSAVLEGFWLDIAWLWQEPLPTLADVLSRWQAGPGPQKVE